MIELLIWAIASVLQKYVANMFIDKDVRLLMSFILTVIWVLIYRYIINNLDPNIIKEVMIAFASSQAIYFKIFKK